MRQLDELELVVVVDNETDTLSSIDNAVQTPESRNILDRGEETVFDHLCCACHGFSVLLTGRIGDQTRTVLFDVGPYSDIWLANADRLGVELATIETIFLSHWHWDHSGALPEVITAIAEARAADGLAPPVMDVHPDRPTQRGVRVNDGRISLLPPEPELGELTAAGAVVAQEGHAHDVADGFFHGSGEIPRLTSFETGLHGHVTRRDGNSDEDFEDDPLILDERYLAAAVAGRGTTVLSACSHAGIINAATAASSLSDAPLDLVLGGYHLSGGAMEQRIPETVEALRALDPQLVAPGHCTGWRAKAALANEFSPSGRYAPSVVGTRYRLTGSAE